MNKLALNGGSPVIRNLLEHQNLVRYKDLERQYLLEAFESDVWDDWPGMDSQASVFEKEWAEFNNSSYAALLTNGTHTLQVALESLEIGYGDEVLVPGITWQATASAVCDVNAIPVLVDVDPRTLTIDPEKAEAAITPRTRAIIPVHLYHRLADMDRLQEIARKHGLYIIEDCAHTHGSQWAGKNAGTIGDFGSFSFQSSKLVNSGEGGALLMQTEDNYLKVVSQRSCGREFKSGVKIHSGNYRMTAFQAGILRGKLAALKENVDRFDKQGLGLDVAIEASPGVSVLFRDPKITRQSSYNFAFMFEPEQWNGVSAAQFRKALAAEVGVDFFTTYAPLNHSDFYYPQTKKRHQLSAEYVAAITPSRWELPECDAVFENAIISLWPLLGCPVTDAPLLTEAITKLYNNQDELRK
ncbi:DegT/DnrJ/EryC1/StrS family aminotransferase [bacterium]|nr:DegT/DnrJ/EryC1/StrS family aminotransferase [bacterium]